MALCYFIYLKIFVQQIPGITLETFIPIQFYVSYILKQIYMLSHKSECKNDTIFMKPLL